MKIGFNEKKDSLRIENLIHNNLDTKTGKSSKVNRLTMTSSSGGVKDMTHIIMSQMVALQRFSPEKSYEENLDKFYDITVDDEGLEWFSCMYDNCGYVQKEEEIIFEHLKQHFLAEIPPNVIKMNLSDNSDEDMIECKPDINQLIPMDVNLEDNNQSTDYCLMEDMNDNEVTEEWEKYVGIRTKDNKQLYFCNYDTNCFCETRFRIHIKVHITKHLENKTIEKRAPIPAIDESLPNIDFIETDYWDKCQPNVFNGRPKRSSTQSTPKSYFIQNSKIKSKSNSKSKSKSNTKSADTSGSQTRSQSASINGSQSPRTPINNRKSSDIIDIGFNQNNTLLSLKGMASIKKLKTHIQCEIIDGLKYFCCNFNKKCGFKSRRSQETANHVHCAHLGFYLRCVRPECNKIFRTPGSWREHQKNHICNFGLYGYQKGVTGVCRNSYLLQFQEKFVTEDNHMAFRCKWKGCQFVTRQRTGCKRHIHNNHVCPHRKTKEWKTQLQYFMSKTSSLTDRPIANASNQSSDRKVYFCRRKHCNAKMSSESELMRHENQLCRYRSEPKRKNKNNLKINPKIRPKLKSQSSSASTSRQSMTETRGQESTKIRTLRSNEKTTENGPRVEGRRLSNNSNTEETNDQNLNNGTDLRSKCEKFIERKIFEGVTYFLCSGPNCKFTTKVENKIYDHISKLHSLLNTSHRPNTRTTTQGSGQSTDQINDTIRVESPSAKSETTPKPHKRQNSSNSSPKKASNCNNSKTNDNIDNSFRQKSSQNLIPTSSRNSTPNSSVISSKTSSTAPKKSDNIDDKFKNFFEIKRIDSEPNYFCRYPNIVCRFYATTKKEMYEHISEEHIFFVCDIKNCKREFKTETSLKQHKLNHICGFGIEGMKASGVCALENVRQYRREILVDDRYKYQCKVCKFISTSKSIVLSHAHNRHIHPQPPPE